MAYLFVLVLVAHLAALVEGATSIYGAPGLQLFALCCCGLVDAASAMPAGVGWAGAAAGAGIASEAIIGAVGSRALRSSVVQSGAKATTGQRLSVDKLYPSLNTEPSAVRTRTAANDQGTNQRRWEKGAANQPGRSIARSHDIVTELKPEVIASSHSHSNAIDIHTVTVGTHVIVDQRVAMGWEGGPAIVTKAYQPEKNKECAHICVKINGKGRQLKVREDTATFPARRNGRLAAVPKRKGAPEPSPKASKASGASFASPRTASCDSKVPSTASKTPADQSEWPGRLTVKVARQTIVLMNRNQRSRRTSTMNWSSTSMSTRLPIAILLSGCGSHLVLTPRRVTWRAGHRKCCSLYCVTWALSSARCIRH